MLKALSADAEVAGKEEFASQYLAKRGKSLLCSLHHSIGQSVVLNDPTWFFSCSHSALSLSIKGGAGGWSGRWSSCWRAAKSCALKINEFVIQLS